MLNEPRYKFEQQGALCLLHLENVDLQKKCTKS